MDAKQAATHASVQEGLLRIEDTLYASGAVVTATGDNEAGVTLAFENVLVGKDNLFALVVRIASERAASTSRSRWQRLSDEVLRRYAMLQAELPGDVREALLDCAGPVVLLNGARVR